MNLLLKAKHWHLFLAMFGVPFLFQLVMMTGMISAVQQDSSVDDLMNYFKLFPVIMLLFMGTLFGWIWSVAIGLQKAVPALIKMNVTRFKIFFFIPIIYICAISLAIPFFIGSTFAGHEPGPAFPAIIMLIIPLHLFSMVCIFYTLYFTAKTIKTIELQRGTSFGDFAGEFFLIWFYFVGIWILQPRINAIVAQLGSTNLYPDNKPDII